MGCDSSYEEYLLCANNIRPRSTCALHLMGDLRRVPGAVPTNSPVAAYRLTDLGNSYGTSSLAMSVDLAGRLARKQSRNRAVSGRVPAPLLSRQSHLSGHFRNNSYGHRGDNLRP